MTSSTTDAPLPESPQDPEIILLKQRVEMLEARLAELISREYPVVYAPLYPAMPAAPAPLVYDLGYPTTLRPFTNVRAGAAAGAAAMPVNYVQIVPA